MSTFTRALLHVSSGTDITSPDRVRRTCTLGCAISNRLTLTSLRTIRHTVRGRAGGTGNNSGSTRTLLSVFGGIRPLLTRKGTTHTTGLSTSRGGLVEDCNLVALGPAVCVTGISRSNFRGGPCLSTMHGCTANRSSVIVTLYGRVRSRVTRLSRSSGGSFLTRVSVRRTNLSRIVHNNCSLLSVRACFATNIGRIHT